jgi:hypothetical protein
MEKIELNAPASGHLLKVVKGLLQFGWTVTQAPDDGRLARNGQLLVLRADKQDVRIRLFVYKVTGSSRGKPDERRVEITSTYEKKPNPLTKVRGFQDVVLGYDYDHDVYVGVDRKRMHEGGETGNASSFFDREGLEWTKQNEILIRPRAARLFSGGTEYHAFFKSARLPEYILNVDAIHAGSYAGYGLHSGRARAMKDDPSLEIPATIATDSALVLEGPGTPTIRPKISKKLVKAFEEGDTKTLTKRKISPEDLLAVKRKCEENGQIGEEFVLNFERRRLRAAGKEALAKAVKWVSQESTCEGYDILSFEVNGEKRFIEVKATSGNGRVFDMSDNEWRCAKAKGKTYFIYRVSEVRTRPVVKLYQNPAELEAKGLLHKAPSGWWIKLL